MSEETENKNLSLSEQQELENRESVERQRKSREEGRNRRAARKAEREELANAESISQRREIKERFNKIQGAIEEGAIFDVNTNTVSTNQSSLNYTIDDDGIDTIDVGDLLVGLAEETLDVVNSDNTAGQRVFLIKAV